MTNHPIRRHLLIFLALLPPLFAEEPALRDLLRDALYTEEVSGDAEKAASQYEALIARHDEQRPFAANALFRLAEIRRQQDRKDEAPLSIAGSSVPFPMPNRRQNFPVRGWLAWEKHPQQATPPPRSLTTNRRSCCAFNN